MTRVFTVKLHELQAALDSFERALDMAKVQGDEAAEAAIKKAIDDVNAKIVRDIKEDKDDKAGECVTLCLSEVSGGCVTLCLSEVGGGCVILCVRDVTGADVFFHCS